MQDKSNDGEGLEVGLDKEDDEDTWGVDEVAAGIEADDRGLEVERGIAFVAPIGLEEEQLADQEESKEASIHHVYQFRYPLTCGNSRISSGICMLVRKKTNSSEKLLQLWLIKS